MTSTKHSPLHLEAPRLIADAALGERLAVLARASTPSAASRVRRSGWRVPLVAFATIAASSGMAYAGQSALDHQLKTEPVGPAVTSTVTSPGTAATSARPEAPQPAPKSSHTNPHGKVVGKGHPKTGKAKGHPGKHDAGKHYGHPPN